MLGIITEYGESEGATLARRALRLYGNMPAVRNACAGSQYAALQDY